MKLYQFPSSPHCIKVRAVAYELGVDLELATVNIFRGDARDPAFEALNPNGWVPVLVDGDFVLWESNAIITYLADMHPMVGSTSARERADVQRWLHWQSAHFAPTVTKVAFERFVKPMTRPGGIDHAAATKAETDFLRCGRVLETSLGNSEYLTQRLSVADFALACILSSANVVGLSVAAFPRTKDWLARMLARESVRRAFADAQLSTIALCEVDRNGRASD